VKALIVIPLTKINALKALKALEGEHPKTSRVETQLKANSKGLEIIIKSKDVNSMRAALNTTLKLYKVHEEVKKECLK